MIKIILMFIVLSINSLALKIDSVDFDKKLGKGETVTKEFVLKNSDNYHIQYNIEVEGKPKNVKIEPTNIVIPPFETRTFKVSVTGINKGKGSYFLILRENKLNIDENITQVKVKMNYRIEQEYIVE